MAASYAALFANATAASSRPVDWATAPVSCRSASTRAYCSGPETGATCAKFFAAAQHRRTADVDHLDGVGHAGAAARGDRAEGIEVHAHDVERLDLLLVE